MTNKEAFIEFRNGAVFVLAVLSGSALFIALFFSSEPQSSKKFEVVDRYKNCDVVRYTDHSNNWHYFLDCNKDG